MASVQDLKRRVRSVKNTRKITKAMELVASARLRRAQTRIEAMRPYAETMRELIAGVGRASSSVLGLPLLQQRDEEKTVAVVALTGDRGLAGPFNAQIIRRAFALERQLRGEGKEVKFIAVGKKGRSTFAAQLPLERECPADDLRVERPGEPAVAGERDHGDGLRIVPLLQQRQPPDRGARASDARDQLAHRLGIRSHRLDPRLRAAQAGRGDELHRLRDLARVPDRPDAPLEILDRGH